MKNTSKVKIYLINAYSNYDSEKFFISGSDKVALSLAGEDKENSIIIAPNSIKKILPQGIKFIPSQEKFSKVILVDYIFRVISTYFILKKLGSGKIILSSSDFFCDVVPAFLCSRDNDWYAFTFHLYPSFKENFKIRDFFGKLLQDFSYSLFKSAKKIFTSNFECVDYLSSRFKILSTQKIPLGIKINNYSISKSKEIDVLFLGRIKESKGIFDLPEIVSIVKSKIPNLNVVVIGNGPTSEVERIKSLDKEFGSDIKFMGSVEDSEVVDALAMSKILIQLDSEGGFGLNIVEALASGVEVVGYKLPSYEDNFKEFELNMFPQRDKEAVATCIISILQNYKIPTQIPKSLSYFEWSSIYKKIFSN